MVTKAVVALFTMAESEESVPSVSAPSSNSFLAVSTPLESAVSTSNISEVSSRSEMLSKLCFTKLLPVPSQSHVTLIGVVTTESIEHFRRKWFFYRVTLLRKSNRADDSDEGLWIDLEYFLSWLFLINNDFLTLDAPAFSRGVACKCQS